jgi:hypothetical protein
LTGLTFDAVHFDSVVDLGLTTDLDALILGEVRLETECAAGSLLTEVTVAGGDERRFVLHGDVYSTTTACRCPRGHARLPHCRTKGTNVVLVAPDGARTMPVLVADPLAHPSVR